MDRSSHALGAETSKFITVKITNHGQGINSSNSIFFFFPQVETQVELNYQVFFSPLAAVAISVDWGLFSAGFTDAGRQVW